LAEGKRKRNSSGTGERKKALDPGLKTRFAGSGILLKKKMDAVHRRQKPNAPSTQTHSSASVQKREVAQKRGVTGVPEQCKGKRRASDPENWEEVPQQLFPVQASV